MVKVVLLPTCALLDARSREESPRTSSTFSQSYPRDFSCDARGAGVGVRAEVPDPGVDVQPAVGGDAHQPVLAALARPMVGLADPDPGYAGPLALAAARQPLLPSEALGALGKRLSQMSAGDGPLAAAVEGVRVGGVDAADGQLVDTQLARRLVEQRFHRAGDLVLARTPLRAARWRVGEDGNPAEAHRQRRIDYGDGAGRAVEVAEAAVGPVFLDDEEIDGAEPPVTSESHANPALESRSRRADRVFFGAADAHHHRPARLPGHVRRHRHDRIGAALGAESAPAVLAHVDQVLGRDADVAGQAVQHRALALGRAEDVALAVLPVGHRRARLHRVVRGARGDEGLVEDQRRVAEACFDIPVGPLGGDLAHGQVAAGGRGEVRLRPLDLRDALAALGVLPSSRALGPPGRRLSSGSTTKGRGSRSSLTLVMASCAVVSSTAASAAIGSPT